MENKHLLQIRSSFSSLITIIRKIREQKGREDESITKVNDLIFILTICKFNTFSLLLTD